HHRVFIASWDGAKWTKASDWIEPLKDKVRPLIDKEAQTYASSTAGWPKRSEACDKAS
ncbi:MAG: ABC transporter permease, partial [Variibacter sp.]|nr:ABC transporter permease [Variibacter sp.]